MWDLIEVDKTCKFVSQINSSGYSFSIAILVCLFYNFNGKPQLDYRLGQFIKVTLFFLI